MDQKPLHQVGRQPQECSLLIRSARRGGTQGFDFDQFEIELMYQRGWLQRVTGALGTHARDGDAPQFRIENLNQPASRRLITSAKARHQAGYGVGLKRGRGGGRRDYFNLRKKMETPYSFAHFVISCVANSRYFLIRRERMATKASGISDDATKLVAKIYKLKEHAMKIVAQAEQLAAATTADKKTASQAKKIAAEARKMADVARPAKKTEG
jgi:hypothetical protein